MRLKSRCCQPNQGHERSQLTGCISHNFLEKQTNRIYIQEEIYHKGSVHAIMEAEISHNLQFVS